MLPQLNECQPSKPSAVDRHCQPEARSRTILMRSPVHSEIIPHVNTISLLFSKAASLIPTASMKLEFAGHMDFPGCLEQNRSRIGL